MSIEALECRNAAQPRAGAIVFHNDFVLLMYRKKEGKEYYTFPGGTVEIGETIEDAVARELIEEASIVANPVRLLYCLQVINSPVHSLHEVNVLCCKQEYFFLCDYVSGVPVLSFDAVECQRMNDNNFYKPMWISVGQIKSLIVYPLEIRNILIADLDMGLSLASKEISVLNCDLRHT